MEQEKTHKYSIYFWLWSGEINFCIEHNWKFWNRINKNLNFCACVTSFNSIGQIYKGRKKIVNINAAFLVKQILREFKTWRFKENSALQYQHCCTFFYIQMSNSLPNQPATTPQENANLFIDSSEMVNETLTEKKTIKINNNDIEINSIKVMPLSMVVLTVAG